MRTTAVATVVVGLALAFGAVSLLLLLRRSQVASLEDAIKVRATEIAGLGQAGRLPNPIVARVEDSSLVQVVDDSGKVVAASENIVGEPRLTTLVPGDADPSLLTIHDLPIGEAGADYRVVALRARSPEGARVVYVAASLNSVDENVRQVGGILAAGLPALLALVGAITWVMVGRAFRPVERIRAEVADLSARDLGRRVPEPSAHDEVGRLARTMNEMLARLEQSAVRERGFVGDASHELRSPVAALRTQLEVTRRGDGRAWTGADEEMLDEVLRLEALIDNLLVLARSDASLDRRDHGALDLDDIVLAEVGRTRAGGVPVVVGAFEPARVRGDGGELGRVVRNLLENAQRHARSSVSVELRRAGDQARLVVEDDGPGVADGDRERIFERFTRLDDARDRRHGGAGLGLAIVREVVRGHGGHVVVEDGAVGGGRFVVTLPLEADPRS